MTNGLKLAIDLFQLMFFVAMNFVTKTAWWDDKNTKKSY